MDGLIPSSGNTFPDTALRTEEKVFFTSILECQVLLIIHNLLFFNIEWKYLSFTQYKKNIKKTT